MSKHTGGPAFPSLRDERRNPDFAHEEGMSLRDGIGDVLVTLVIVARLRNLDLRECLEQAYYEIKDRRGTLMPNGVFVKEECNQ